MTSFLFTLRLPDKVLHDIPGDTDQEKSGRLNVSLAEWLTKNVPNEGTVFMGYP